MVVERERFERNDALARADRVDDHVTGDACDEGAGLGRVGELAPGEGDDGPGEGLLDGLLGGVGIAEGAQGEEVEAGAEALQGVARYSWLVFLLEDVECHALTLPPTTR